MRAILRACATESASKKVVVVSPTRCSTFGLRRNVANDLRESTLAPSDLLIVDLPDLNESSLSWKESMIVVLAPRLLILGIFCMFCAVCRREADTRRTRRGTGGLGRADQPLAVVEGARRIVREHHVHALHRGAERRWVAVIDVDGLDAGTEGGRRIRAAHGRAHRVPMGPRSRHLRTPLVTGGAEHEDRRQSTGHGHQGATAGAVSCLRYIARSK